MWGIFKSTLNWDLQEKSGKMQKKNKAKIETNRKNPQQNKQTNKQRNINNSIYDHILISHL